MSQLDEELLRSLLQQQFYEPIDQIIDRYHSTRIPIPGSHLVINKMADLLQLTISFIDNKNVLSQKTLTFLSQQLSIDKESIKSSLTSRISVISDTTHFNQDENSLFCFLVVSGLIEAVQLVNTKKVNYLLMENLHFLEECSTIGFNDLISRLPPQWYSEYSILVNLKVLEHYIHLTNQKVDFIPFDIYKNRVIYALRRIYH